MATEDESLDTKKDIFIRALRSKMRQYRTDQRLALESCSDREYNLKYKEESETKRENKKKEIVQIFKDEEDKLTPDETSTPEYNRNLNMISKYKESIRTLKEKLLI